MSTKSASVQYKRDVSQIQLPLLRATLLELTKRQVMEPTIT